MVSHRVALNQKIESKLIEVNVSLISTLHTQLFVVKHHGIAFVPGIHQCDLASLDISLQKM